MTSGILYQSTFDAASGAPYQQLSNLMVAGVSTQDATGTLNHDGGKLYGSFSYSAPTYTLNFYKDILKTNLVMTGSSTALGPVTLTTSNSSGLTGTVNFAQYQANDTNIVAVVCLSTDADLPQANLTTLSDYDPYVGFALYHLQAFAALQNIVLNKMRSDLYNQNYIDSTSLKSVGGYDLSRCITFLKNPPEMRQCAAEYAYYKIAERQGITNNNFAMRAKASKENFASYLGALALELDKNQVRMPTSTRSMRSFKVSR